MARNTKEQIASPEQKDLLSDAVLEMALERLREELEQSKPKVQPETLVGLVFDGVEVTEPLAKEVFSRLKGRGDLTSRGKGRRQRWHIEGGRTPAAKRAAQANEEYENSFADEEMGDEQVNESAEDVGQANKHEKTSLEEEGSKATEVVTTFEQEAKDILDELKQNNWKFADRVPALQNEIKRIQSGDGYRDLDTGEKNYLLGLLEEELSGVQNKLEQRAQRKAQSEERKMQKGTEKISDKEQEGEQKVYLYSDEQAEGMLQDMLVNYEESFTEAENLQEREKDIQGISDAIEDFKNGYASKSVSPEMKQKAIERLRALKTKMEAQMYTAEKGNRQSMQMDSDFDAGDESEDGEVVQLKDDYISQERTTPKSSSDFDDIDTDEVLKDEGKIPVEARTIEKGEEELDDASVRPEIKQQLKHEYEENLQKYAAASDEKKRKYIQKMEDAKEIFEQALQSESARKEGNWSIAEVEQALFYIDSFLRRAKQDQIKSEEYGFADKGFEEGEIRDEKIDEYKAVIAEYRKQFDEGTEEEQGRIRRLVHQLDEEFKALPERENDPKRLELSLAEIALVGAMFQKLEDYVLLSGEGDDFDIGAIPIDESKEGEGIDPSNIEIPSSPGKERESGQQEKKERFRKRDVAKAIAKGAFWAAASFSGARFGYLAGRAGLVAVQKMLGGTAGDVEYKQLNKILESETKEKGVRDPINDRIERLKGAIERLSSKSAAEKQELLAELVKVAATRDEAHQQNDAQLEGNMRALLQERLTTRIIESKGEFAREALNAAAVVGYASGYGLVTAAARPALYTGISATERVKTVYTEMGRSGERGVGTFAKKYFVDGFTETMKNAVGRGEAEGRLRKAVDAVHAWTTISRTIGLVGEATGAGIGLTYEAAKALQEHGPSKEQIDDVLNKALESVGIDFSAETETVAEAVAQATDAGEVAKGADVVMRGTEAARETVVESAGGGTVFENPGETVLESSIEVTREQLEVREVQKNDTIVRIIERQVASDPQRFGYTGDVLDQDAKEAWASKLALDYARGSGIIMEGYDMRLAQDAIDNISIIADPEDGVRFYDLAGNEVDVDEYVYWGRTIGAPSIGEAQMLAQSPREGLLLEALEEVPEAASSQELVPGIEATTIDLESGLQKKFTFAEHGSLTFSYNEEGEITSIEKMKISAPKELYDRVTGVVQNESAIDVDHMADLEYVSSQLYLLSEYERAGMKDSAEYAAVLASFRQTMKDKSEVLTLDVHDPLFKNYLEGMDILESSIQDLPRPSEVIEQTRGEQLTQSAAIQEQLEPRAFQVSGNAEVIALNGNRGRVAFTYGADGKITGMNTQEMKFGVFARASMVGLVEENNYVPKALREGYDAPSGRFAARTEIARKLYALRVTEEALENSGVPFRDPRRRFIHDEALRQIGEFNDKWVGVQKVNIGSAKFRSLGI